MRPPGDSGKPFSKKDCSEFITIEVQTRLAAARSRGYTLSAAQFFVTQYPARATFARSIYGKQTGILWRRVPPHCPGGNSHYVAALRLDCYAAAFYEQLTFYHEVVLTVRMFIGPRFRSQFPLEQRRLGPTALQWWHDDPTFRFVVPAQFGSRIFRRRVRSVGHALFSCCGALDPEYMGELANR